MDRLMELLFCMSGRVPRWEDEEKFSNDLDVLREDFRRRFLAKGEQASPLAPLPVQKNQNDLDV